MQLLEILDDRHRLGEPAAVVELERGHERLGVHRAVGRLAMLPLRQVDEARLVGEPLQVERDAHAKGGGAAEVRVQLHSAATTFTLSSPTLSMPACSSSPGLTGPTPAGVPE